MGSAPGSKLQADYTVTQDPTCSPNSFVEKVFPMVEVRDSKMEKKWYMMPFKLSAPNWHPVLSAHISLAGANSTSRLKGNGKGK